MCTVDMYIYIYMPYCKAGKDKDNKLPANDCAVLLHRRQCKWLTKERECGEVSECHAVSHFWRLQAASGNGSLRGWSGRVKMQLKDWGFAVWLSRIQPQAVAGFELFRLSTSFEEFWDVLLLELHIWTYLGTIEHLPSINGCIFLVDYLI